MKSFDRLYLLLLILILSQFLCTFISKYTFLPSFYAIRSVQAIRQSFFSVNLNFRNLNTFFLQSVNIHKNNKNIFIKNKPQKQKMQKKNSESEGNNEQQVHYIDQKSKQVSKILQSSQIFIDEEYQQINVSIKNLNIERTIKIQTFYYVIEVHSHHSNLHWEIERRYSDFEWLYNALIFSYPGCILPYFPIKSIENFMVTKLGIQYGEQSKQQHLNIRKDELEIFLNGICAHPLLKQAEQTKIFLNQNKEEFVKNKKAIQAQISQSQSEQSSSNGIVSIFQRSVAWITSSTKNEAFNMENVEGWDSYEKQIKLWIFQYSALIEKVEKLIEIKQTEAEWQGPETDIDSVEQLKARVVSGQQYNKIFEEDLRENIIKNIQYQAKCLKQIQSQLEQRQNIIKIINYIYKFTNSNNRSNKLIRKKEKFEINMCRQWPIFKDELRIKIRSVQKKFHEIWLKYCRKVHKIWKQK